MRKPYENFHIFHFQKRIVSTETICGNTVGNIDRAGSFWKIIEELSLIRHPVYWSSTGLFGPSTDSQLQSLDCLRTKSPQPFSPTALCFKI